jgi:FkbM family methyltransferase
MTFVDLGANIGYFSLLTAQAVGPAGRVFAFEPLPSMADFLARNVRDNGLDNVVQVVRKAVSERTDVVGFCFDEHNSVSAHIHTEGHPAGSTIDVESVTLDTFLAEAGWPPVHLVKMDVEGAKLAAIRGMRELVGRNKELVLVFEFLHQHFGVDTERLHELFDTLGTLGFARFRVLHRDGGAVRLPGDLPQLVTLSKRANLNILAQQR